MGTVSLSAYFETYGGGAPSHWKFGGDFLTREEAEEFAAQFPKKCKVSVHTVSSLDGNWFGIGSSGNLTPSGVNKGINEAGVARYFAIKATLERLGIEPVWKTGATNAYQSQVEFEQAITANTASRRHLAFGETIAPPKIDTLRDANCPVCGEGDAYNGIECMVCGFVKPPDMFMDPNVEVAQQNDLRQDQQASAPAGGYVPPQGNAGGASGYVPPAANGQDPASYVPPTVEDDPEDEDEETADDKKRPVKKSQRILAGV